MLYAGGITLFYPTIQENAAEFEKLLEIYPKELMAAFGIEGSLGDPGMFLNSYIFQFLWPLVAAIVAILLATRVAADAETGFLELPLSTRLSRLRYLAATIAGQVVAMAVAGRVTVGAIWRSTCSSSPTSRPTASSSPVPRAAIGLAIAGVTTLLAVVLLDRGRAGGLAAGILIVMYLVNVLAQMSPDIAASAPFGIPLLRPQGAHRYGRLPARRFAALSGGCRRRLAARPCGLPATRPHGLRICPDDSPRVQRTGLPCERYGGRRPDRISPELERPGPLDDGRLARARSPTPGR